MAELRKYSVLICEGGPGAPCGALHDRPDAGCPECDSLDYARVTAIDERDVAPLIEAVGETLCDDIPCSRCDHLRTALQPFQDSKDDSTLGGDAGTTNPYVRSPVAEAAIECLEEREVEAADRLAEHRAERDPMGTSQGSLVIYTEKRIYRDAILVLADADYERHVLTSPGVAGAIEAAVEEVGGSDHDDNRSRLPTLDDVFGPITHCPTCGCSVETVTSEEGTSFFRPIAEDALRDLLAWCRENAADLSLNPFITNTYGIVATRIRTRYLANEQQGGER